MNSPNMHVYWLWEEARTPTEQTQGEHAQWTESPQILVKSQTQNFLALQWQLLLALILAMFKSTLN